MSTARHIHVLKKQRRASEITELYRALRKGREEAKDEPGAADFYYGGMEMRRQSVRRFHPEHLILWLYWVSSGYALRASRALACFTGVVFLATVLLAAVGLPPSEESVAAVGKITGRPPNQSIQLIPSAVISDKPPSLPTRLGTASLVALEGAVFRSSDQELTYRGRIIQTILRFFGPVLLGLALLSIRARVKR